MNGEQWPELVPCVQRQWALCGGGAWGAPSPQWTCSLCQAAQHSTGGPRAVKELQTQVLRGPGGSA